MAEHLTPANTIDERNAAPYLGYTPAALRAWRYQKRGPAYIRHGRSVRYRVADLDDWLERHCVRTREDSRY